MADKLKVVYKEIGKRPKTMFIDDTLEAKQKIVGGLIEIIPYKENLLLVCNEEGKIMNLPANVQFPNDYIAGDFFVVGDDFENSGYKSLTQKEIMEVKKDLNSRTILYPEIDYLDNKDEMEVE